MNSVISGIGMTMASISKAAALNNPNDKIKAFEAINDKVNSLDLEITGVGVTPVRRTYLVEQRDYYMNEGILMRKRQKRIMAQLEIE